MATQNHEMPPPTTAQLVADEKKRHEEQAAEARKIFDGYEKDDEGSVTTQTDQLRRSRDMERVGVAAYMAEGERRIRERQGDPPIEPRQIHGVAPVKPPPR